MPCSLSAAYRNEKRELGLSPGVFLRLRHSPTERVSRGASNGMRGLLAVNRLRCGSVCGNSSPIRTKASMVGRQRWVAPVPAFVVVTETQVRFGQA